MKKYQLIIGVLLTLTVKVNAQNWNRSGFIAGDGVMELGKYLDFHDSNTGLEDYSLRLAILGNSLHSTGNFHLAGLGLNTTNLVDTKMHIFGDFWNTTNLILSANYENSYRWKFKTIDRGSAIDLDIIGTNISDQEEPVLKLSPSFSGRPELSFMNNWLIINNGNVGIGTVSPSEKLAVNGNIRAKEIKVETSNWPDYVFEEGYNLLGLSELERYIKINKHLPEMPSATEVEKNGVALGEMNKLLLKKIEELTLLLLEVKNQSDKKINVLSTEIQKLKNN